MEEYTNSNNNNPLSENAGQCPSSRATFLYTAAAVGGSSGGNHHHHQHQQQLPINTFHLPSSGSGHHCFQSDQVPHDDPNVKTESSTQLLHTPIFHYPLLRGNLLLHPQPTHQQGGGQSSSEVEEDIKAKIISHPQYSNLLQVYIDCQKVGAPPEVVARMAAAQQDFEARQRSLVSSKLEASKDPELDQFMEAYYDMLVKYKEELTRPIQEAMDFMRRTETQLNMLCNGPLHIFSDDKCEGVVSSEDDQDNSGGETELHEIDPRAEDRELKNHLLKKYSGYLGSLKQELSKKKKKGKLPKDARQKLLNWWELHYKWPYPSESEKIALAESTGLDQKQINNWFINQRKRHWQPSEDMQFMVMESLHPQNAAGIYLADGHYSLGP
ncbi:hypothetical protein RIF29_12601 [Crotalaria pallida]|uniref:Uncharacterized protein n=1 Tax=Crotalaria pallida TaxID=3830 RepID=A0AAN9P1W6_CROPI